jgi:RND family efflux transporter MFP subunit
MTTDVREKLKSIVTPILIMLVFSIVAFALLNTAPISKRTPPLMATPIVESDNSIKTEHSVFISAHGRIISAHKPLTVVSLVSGIIVESHINLMEGGHISANETLLQIDQTDPKLILEEAEAKLLQAKASLAIESGQHRLAKKEFALNKFEFKDDGENKALALRLPNLQLATSEVELAEIQIKKAQINLERTKISFPFDVSILSLSANIGEFVTEQRILATISKANAFWVELYLPSKYITKIKTKSSESAGSLIILIYEQREYEAEVLSIKASLSESTQMVGIIAEIKYPIIGSNNVPQFVIGTQISATIDAGTIHNVIKVPRHALINSSEIYIVDGEQTLQLRDVHVEWETAQHVFIKTNLSKDEIIVSSKVFGIPLGKKVKVLNKSAAIVSKSERDE